MPVTQVRQLYANFPRPIRSGSAIWQAPRSIRSPIPERRCHHQYRQQVPAHGAAPIVPRGPKIDMRIDYGSMGNDAH
jgi:hypothetical protein